MKFGQAYANRLRRRRARAGDTWRLDEVVIEDQRQDPRPVVRGRPARQCARRPGAVTPKRVGRQEVLPPTTQGMRYVPRVLVTDRLASYGPADRVVMPSVEHRQSKYLNQSGPERASTDPATRAGDETVHLAPACATVAVRVRPHLATLPSAAASAVGHWMAPRYGRALHRLEPDHRGYHDRRLNVNSDRAFHQNDAQHADDKSTN